ncbi:methylenetetrahydrofolate reductase [NAD(P)H] [Malassezia vespertilionis]|uniref:methylenetetrahydrofolate reductase [NAD(P)H] n=1 Tax=Malassezia vespertilionis TaxID=2020962 RepID=UPI0024B25E2F|nr:methylenetetrahydrofolate reductase [NAD(P)H] [Malassezia vespertilionis]WFD06079.1 methylenetetrahydrofolate reductase [NAD(P)H] [Malassezia vespertilionis]
MPERRVARIDEKLAQKQDGILWSLEFFPPKTSDGMANLYARIERMTAKLHPGWVHVTWGSGGSTRDISLELAVRVQNGFFDPSMNWRAELDNSGPRTGGCDVCLHMTCTDVERSFLDTALADAKRYGICNILALRGDPPRGEESWIATDQQFQTSIDLVKYVRKQHGDAFCIGVAGYPEGLSGHTPEDVARDIGFLKQKQDAGAQFIVTQFFYEPEKFHTWHARCRAHGITIPIIPGVMPIQNYHSFRRMTNLCRLQVPTPLLEALEPIKTDDASVKDVGVQVAHTIVDQVHKQDQIAAFHLYTLNLEKSVTRVITGAKAGAGELRAEKGALVRSPADWEWDEFPNGRYGDSRSPAFGELDGYGASLKVPPEEAMRLWGTPVDESDIRRIFTNYVKGSLACIPWCDVPVWDETAPLLPALTRLNDGKGWWTVGSQPAVNGIDSSDPTYGFGPKNGFIFQKSFVEMFMSEKDKRALVERIGQSETPITFYAAMHDPASFETNVGEHGLNAVTWGVFPGKEVAQSTIIEAQSFMAWRDEAFAIWREWELLFPPRSASRKFLRAIHDTYWLVTVVHHDYKDADGLWRFLTQA